MTASASSAAASGASLSSASSSRFELEHEQPVDVAAELRRQESAAPRARAARARRPPRDEAGCRRRGRRRSRPTARRPARARRRCAPSRTASARDRAYAASNASSCQSKPPQRSAVHVSIGSRIERKSASSSVSAEPGVRAREDRGGRLAPKVLDRVARVGQAAQRRRLLLDEAAHERPVLVERRPAARRVLLEGERHLRAALGRERAEAERAQGLVEMRGAQHAHITRRARLLSCLAARAPVRGAVVVAAAPRRDRRAAARARPPGAAVDAAARRRDRRRPTRASAPRPARARAAGRPPTRRRAARHGESCAVPERLGEPHVPDPGDERLVEERLAERARAVGAHACRASIASSAAARSRMSGPSRASARVVQLEHRPVPEDGLDARRRAARATGVPDAPLARAGAPPAAGHAQVRAHDDAAREPKQQVLADRLDRLEHAARRPCSATRVGRARGCGDSAAIALADERLQPMRRAVQRVALGHGSNGNVRRTTAARRCRGPGRPPSRR